MTENPRHAGAADPDEAPPSQPPDEAVDGGGAEAGPSEGRHAESVVTDPGSDPVEADLDAAFDIALPDDQPSELAALRAELDERTRDLQRMTAEFANYRKRVDRDRALVVEQAVGGVLATLLPVLDDLDRAREHGDLVGPFGSVAEQLTAALSKFGLNPFGAPGDGFDPTLHEAVSHTVSDEVDKPTCVGVMRRGYLLGERLLRPAMVAVADPQ